MKTVTVFGSSMPKPGEEEYENAYLIGKLLGESGFSVCTGGYQGIMDAVSKGATEAGTNAIGITVDVFAATPSRYLTTEIKTHTLSERLSKLVGIGQGYIVLPGGTGTFLELAVVWEYLNKRLINEKPVAVLGDMWRPIIDSMESRINFEQRKTGLIKTFNNVEKSVQFICQAIGED